MRALIWLESLAQDIAYAFRAMRRVPLVTAAAIASLALGIGANASIFALINAVMLRSLPVREPQDLIQAGWIAKQFPRRFVESTSGRSGLLDSRNARFPFSLQTYEQIRAHTTTLSGVFGRSLVFDKAIVVAQGRADTASVDLVSGNFFQTLGVRAAAGRRLEDADDREGAAPMVVLGDGYWTRRFRADPAIAGQGILINGVSFTIAGVAAEPFRGLDAGSSIDLWIPLHAQPLIAIKGRKNSNMLDAPGLWWVEIVGRRKPGVSAERVRMELDTLFRQSLVARGDRPVRPEDYPSLVVGSASQGQGGLRQRFSKPLIVLMTIVGFVLLIACANVANLLMARAVARRKEMAMRHALGASPRRLFRQMIAENVLLSLAAGCGAALVLRWDTGALLRLVSSETDPLVLDLGLDFTVLAFLIAVSVVVGLLFGVVPAAQAARIDLNTVLKGVSKTSPGDSVLRRFGFGRALVVLQVAVSLALLTGAGLYLRTLWNLRHIALGFNADNVLVFRVSPKRAGYEGDRMMQLIDRISEGLENLPGVRAVSYTHLGLLGGWVTSGPVRVIGQPQNQSDSKTVLFLYVGPKFFEAMQLPLLGGRAPDVRDGRNSPRVAVVNEAFAREYFAKGSPLGQRVTYFLDEYKTPIEIVGIARDAKYESVSEPVQPTIYLPYAQQVDRATEVSFQVRTAGDPRAAASSIRNLMQSLEPRLPVFGLTTEAAQRDENLRDQRLMADLAACFAALALFLAAIGLYGVISYSVSRRTAEIGIRMALGAHRGRVLGEVLRESLGVVIAGIGIAWAATRLIASQLYGLQAHDPVNLLLAAAILFGVALVAIYLPARRASMVDPMSALRHE